MPERLVYYCLASNCRRFDSDIIGAPRCENLELITTEWFAHFSYFFLHACQLTLIARFNGPDRANARLGQINILINFLLIRIFYVDAHIDGVSRANAFSVASECVIALDGYASSGSIIISIKTKRFTLLIYMYIRRL